jgi:thermitase
MTNRYAYLPAVVFIVLVGCICLFLLVKSRRKSSFLNAEKSSAPVNQAGEGYVPLNIKPVIVPVLRPGDGSEVGRMPVGAENGNERQGTRPEPDVIDDEYVLTFFSERDRKAFMDLAESRGAEILAVNDFGNSVRIRVKTGKDFEALLAEGPTPVDYSSNYYVLAPERPVSEPGEAVHDYVAFADNAIPWLGADRERSSWGQGVTVAVLDTGVELHPSLVEQNITRLTLDDFENSDRSEYKGHATAVASIIAGNDDKTPGIAPAVSILSVQVLSEEGVGDSFTLAAGIVEAVDNGADIINLCLGTYGDTFFLRQAVEFAREKGVIIVAATGNDGVEGVCYPARYDGVLAVSAVDAAGRHLHFANQGDQVDIVAPGLGVQAAWTDEGIVQFSGTSAAVPFVSGTIAAIMSDSAGLSAGDAAAIVLDYTDDAGAPGRDSVYGNGVLSVRRAFDRDVKGIYDAVVGIPYIRTAETGRDELAVGVYVQNRGTEILEAVELNVSIDGRQELLSFYNVGVGKTVTHDFLVDGARLERPEQVVIVQSAVLRGVADSYPNNNSVTTRLVGTDLSTE